MERKRNDMVCVDMEDLAPTKSPIIFTGPSETLARVNSPWAGTGGASVLPLIPNNDDFELCSLASTDIEEKCSVNVRPVSSDGDSDGPTFPVRFDKNGRVIFQLGKPE